MSYSHAILSPYFLGAPPIPSLDDFSPSSFKQNLFFLSINFLQQWHKSSKDAAAIYTTALLKLLRSQRQWVATLLQKKVSMETKFFFKSLKTQQEKCYIHIFETVLVSCNNVIHDRGAEGKYSNLPPKHFTLLLSFMLTSADKTQPLKINIFFGIFPVRPAST